MGFDLYSGSRIHQNLGMGCSIGKENGIQDRDDRSSGSGGMWDQKLPSRTCMKCLKP